MYKLALVRHGESEWTCRSLSTGWMDVDLTEAGKASVSIVAEALRLPIASASAGDRWLRRGWE
ncbi:MAG: histidine phosphatase family protein [Anaerolineae bacterium]|nr:histidine phosphatase family protein [Anaerolineae bacterium]